MMELMKSECLPVLTDKDIVFVRKKVRDWSIAVGFSLVDQTKVTTAASELARNAVQHGGGGEMEISVVTKPVREILRSGLRLVFADKGPGIKDTGLALTDGYTTAGGMGLGLSGSKRLMDEFNLETEIGKGTRVTVIKWK